MQEMLPHKSLCRDAKGSSKLVTWCHVYYLATNCWDFWCSFQDNMWWCIVFVVIMTVKIMRHCYLHPKILGFYRYCWKFRSCGVLYHISWCGELLRLQNIIVLSSSRSGSPRKMTHTLNGLLNPEDEGTTVICNISNCIKTPILCSHILCFSWF